MTDYETLAERLGLEDDAETLADRLNLRSGARVFETSDEDPRRRDGRKDCPYGVTD